jgi:hypothetical protein
MSKSRDAVADISKLQRKKRLSSTFYTQAKVVTITAIKTGCVFVVASGRSADISNRGMKEGWGSVVKYRNCTSCGRAVDRN